MKNGIEIKRIWLFLLFAFSFAWAIELFIYFRGGLTNFSSSIPVGAFLVVIMAAPALANILTRLITKEGWKDVKLRSLFRQGKVYWLLAWFGTPLLMLLGMAFYFVLFPQYFDSTLAAAGKMLAARAQQGGAPIALTPLMLVVIQAIQAILLGPILSSLAVLGEEFGWRAYLLYKLMPLGGRKAMLLMGIIWGMWHWPLIFMGYEYGLSYPGHPWLGPIFFLWFTFIIGTLLGWLTLKAKSVWPAVIGHGAINSIAPIALFLFKGQPNTLIGPAVVGVVASLPFAVMAMWALWRAPEFKDIKYTSSSFEAIVVHN